MSKMGSPFTIIFYHHDSAYASAVAGHAFKVVDSFVNIFSNYIDSSELNRLNASAGRGKFIKLTPAMSDMLMLSHKAYKRSAHRFDITIGPLSDLWRVARKSKTFPSRQEIETNRKRTGFNHVRQRGKFSYVRLNKKGMRLDLGGIAQGYIGRKVLEYIQAADIRSVLVDVSGDIAAGEAPPNKKGWILGVNLPRQSEQLQKKKLELSNVSVSTSGDVYQFITYEGKRYSHIIDPRTGYGVTQGKNVTVVAADAVTADWLATACSIVSVRKAMRIARKNKAAILVAYFNNGELKLETNKRFEAYWQK